MPRAENPSLGGGRMIQKIEIEQVEPCFADENKIRVIAKISEDVSDLLPYLNALLANATYIDKAKGSEKGETSTDEISYSDERPALTFTKGQKLITVYPRRVTIAKANDLMDAEVTLRWLVERLNYALEHRDEIRPLKEGKVKIRPLDIFGLLPQINCRACGEHSCLAFALCLLQERRRLSECTPLYQEEKWKGKRKRLEEMVRALGLG